MKIKRVKNKSLGNNENSGSESRLNLMLTLFLIGFIPLFTAAIILTTFANTELKTSLVDSLNLRLRSCATAVNHYFIWDMKEDILDKDDISYAYIDSLKDSNIDQTFFLGDTRFITSIRDDSGNRIENTKADPKIWETVSAGNEYSASGVEIAGNTYYVYYLPVVDDDGNVIGMAFAGEPEEAVIEASKKLTRYMYFIVVALIIVFGVILILVARAIKKPLSHTAECVNVMSNGDLTQEIDVKSKMKETIILVHAATVLQTKLKDIISSVSDQVHSLESSAETLMTLANTSNAGTEQISIAMDELATTANVLAENVQSVNDMVIAMGDDITDIDADVKSLNNSSEKMRSANNKAIVSMKDVLKSSGMSSDIVSKIVAQVQDTNDAIKKINSAVELITEITSQTNLLSLNASIEAARAGEQGKGFAVVADEIKKLSEQSAGGAATIQNIANDILKKSQESVELTHEIQQLIESERIKVAETHDDFEALSNVIEGSIEIASSISNKTERLDSIKSGIIGNINDLSAISEENAASNQEVTASVSGIAESVNDVANNVKQIKDVSQELTNLMKYFKS